MERMTLDTEPVELRCGMCDGTGINPEGEFACDWCDGTKTVMAYLDGKYAPVAYGRRPVVKLGASPTVAERMELRIAVLTEAFDQEQARRIRAEERVEALEAALADNKGAGVWFRGWERAREHYERPTRTVNVPNRDAEHPGKENFRLSGLTERKVSPEGAQS